MTGRVIRVIADKNFGFILGEDGKEYFFHASTVQNSNTFDKKLEGLPVTFEDGEGTKGPRAENVYLD